MTYCANLRGSALFSILLSMFSAAPVWAADYYVDNVVGSDDYDGRSAVVKDQAGPFATIAKAVKLLKPGDTLHLAGTDQPYRQALVVNGLKGTPDQPITFDGHGAWLTGADGLTAEQWVPADVGPKGTYVLQGAKLPEPWWNTLCIDSEMRWPASNQDALADGEFFWWDREKILYGRFSKEHAGATMTVGLADGSSVELPFNKWGLTNFRNKPGLLRNRDLKAAPVSVKINGADAPLLTQPALDRLEPGTFYGDGKTFYFLPPAGKTLKDIRMMVVVRASGVGLSGDVRHLVFKNLNAVYFGNDGYNIHGSAQDVSFLNCNAFFNGDEGFSAHGTCEVLYDGGVVMNCGNGIHNVGNCSTIIRNVIVDKLGLRHDRQDTKAGFRPHELSNVVLIDGGLGVTQTRVDNLLIVGGGSQFGFDCEVRRMTVITPDRLVRVDQGTTLKLEDCLLAAPSGVIHARVDEPAEAASFRKVWFNPALAMEWGAKPPFKTQPLGERFAAHSDIAGGCQATDVDVAAALAKGAVPDGIKEGMGCTPELFQRYLDFLQKRQSLLDQAMHMAWLQP